MSVTTPAENIKKTNQDAITLAQVVPKSNGHKTYDSRERETVPLMDSGKNRTSNSISKTAPKRGPSPKNKEFDEEDLKRQLEHRDAEVVTLRNELEQCESESRHMQSLLDAQMWVKKRLMMIILFGLMLMGLTMLQLVRATMANGECAVIGLQSTGEAALSTNLTSKNRIKKTAVIHMGIHKTGSSSIQKTLDIKYDLLMLDGYFMPYQGQQGYRSRYRKQFRANQVNFATCFLNVTDPPRLTFPCDPHLLLNGMAIANRNENLLVSAETFFKVKAEGMKRLADYLSLWSDVIIIVYYRRFYDWIGSQFNQQFKLRKFRVQDKNMWEATAAGNFAAVMEADVNRYEHFVSGFVSEISKYFGDVRVFNYHDGDTVESFLCNALPNASKTCESYLKEKQKPRWNEFKSSLYFSDLAYAAEKAGLVKISTDWQMKRLANAVEDHVKGLKRTANDFKKKCLSQETLAKIWSISVKNEMALFPKRNTTEEMRTEWEKAAATTLCTIDVEKTLQEKEWKLFFRSYDKAKT